MRLALWLLFVGAFAALNLYGRSEGPPPDDDIVYQYSFGIGSLAGYAVLFSIVLALTIGLPRREVLALRAPESWGRALGLALGALVVIFIGAALALSLSNAGDEQNLTPAGWDSSRAGAYALSFVAVVFAAPITEELLYRGSASRSCWRGRRCRWRSASPQSFRARPRTGALAGRIRLVRDRDRARPAPHRQHLPRLRRPLHLQRIGMTAPLFF